MRQPAIDRQRDGAERRRALLAALVVCAGVGTAAFALGQARVAGTTYVPVPTEYAGSTTSAAPSPVGSTTTENWTAEQPPVAATPQRIAITAPALPLARTTLAPAAGPMPVDYAARDRQIAALKRRMEEIDETIRRVRADPHWYGVVKNSTNTSRQQASDAYLKELDNERDDLRQQKWALEGR